MRHAIPLLAALVFTASPAVAADPAGERCVMLAPLAVSGWLGFMRALADGEADGIAAAADRAHGFVALHGEVGCDRPALAATLDCLTARAFAGTSEAGLQSAAPDCMRDGGLPLR